MIASPPEEAQENRGHTLTPESPKPLHFPSPSNIPILEKQMDPMLGEPAISLATSSFQPQTSQPQPSSAVTASQHGDQFTSHQPQMSVISDNSSGHTYAAVQDNAVDSQKQANAQAEDPSQAQSLSATYGEAATISTIQESLAAYPQDLDLATNFSQLPQSSTGDVPLQPPDDAANTIDVQALLDRLTTPASLADASGGYTAPPVRPQSTDSPGDTPNIALPSAPNLPPRPPAQAKPTTHPNYNAEDDIRSYHPHTGHRGPGSLQTSNLRQGADPPSARANASPTTPAGVQRQNEDRGRSVSSDDDGENQRWPPEINTLYEDFLDEERRFVTEGQWEKFPSGSRLFIGNLPTEKVTKRDIFHRFYKHGRLAQISIKQAYGFVQFLEAEACHRAMQMEQGQAVRGRKMHLEISKPQRNTKKSDSDRKSGGRRRSRSPDYGRGNRPISRGDTYGRTQSVLSPRDRDRDHRRVRDDYRPKRSPSPRGGRDSRRRDRSRDQWDRRRSRSRSPRRYRSPTPPADGLPLPFRAPQDVPDVQVLVNREGLPQDFVRWVEDAFRRAGLRIDVLILSPRLNEEAVTRRQIVEGVLAIASLNTMTMARGKINIRLFDRRGGANNIKFNDYADLDPDTAAALVNNAKQATYQTAHAPASISAHVPAPAPAPPVYAPNYGAAPPMNPYSITQPAQASNAANLTSLISSLDPSTLSQLLGVMSANNGAMAAQSSPAIAPDLARLLGNVVTPGTAPTPSSAFTLPTQQQANPQPYTNPLSHTSLADLLGGQAKQAPAQGTQVPSMDTPNQPDMNQIMAQLAKYQR